MSLRAHTDGCLSKAKSLGSAKWEHCAARAKTSTKACSKKRYHPRSTSMMTGIQSMHPNLCMESNIQEIQAGTKKQ